MRPTSFVMATLVAAAPIGARAATIDPGDFVDEIDNVYLPLVPGTTFFYEGVTDKVPATDVTEVTSETILIEGVRCVVVRDQAFEEGLLVEDTRDYFAQDVDGNVWYFGEDTRELDEDGNVVSTEGTWRAGVDGAQPGIVMEAHPQRGDVVEQELAPGVAEDMAEVLSLKRRICVPAGCFDDVLLTEEWTPLEPKVVERKYYAPGVGFVYSKMLQGGNEVTALVSVQYDP